MKKEQELVLAMLMENTGIAMMDSGGGEGRMWQRNAKRDLTKDPEVLAELPKDTYTLKKDGEFVRWDDDLNKLREYLHNIMGLSYSHMLEHEGYTIEHKKATSDEIEITVSLYHYLPTILELDMLCDEFNTAFAKMADWDSDIYGVSASAEKWLTAHGFTAGSSWNTYNGEQCISQTLQGTELKNDGLGEGDYLLLQVHGGADVRGGYTDAKLFKYNRFQEFIDPCPRVSATLTRADGTTIDLESKESGNGFVASDTGEPVEINEGDKLEASL